MMDNETQDFAQTTLADKITKYEHFLNDVLRTNLGTTLQRRDELYGQIAEYMELQRIIKNIYGLNNTSSDAKEEVKAGSSKSSTSTTSNRSDNINSSLNKTLRTRVDIGCNFYVQAEIEDLNTIVVDIGCGIWLPMSCSEANQFCTKKIDFLQKKVDLLTNDELNIKGQINIVMAALKEIQGL